MDTPAQQNREHSGPLLSFHPDQIGVLVSGHFRRPRVRAEALSHYEETRKTLNQGLRRLVDESDSADGLVRRLPPSMQARTAADHTAKEHPDLRALLARDLMPHDDTWGHLKRLMDVGDDLLQSLVPAPEQEGEHDERDPWFVLPTPHAEMQMAHARHPETHMLHFFRVNHGVPPFGEQESDDQLARGADRVRHVVNLVNLGASELAGSDSAIAAIPNWFCQAAQHDCLSPGSKPEWIPADRIPTQPGYWSFQFNNPRVADLVARQRQRKGRSDVVVAILDTSPTPSAVVNAARRHPRNTLLRRVCSSPNVLIDRDPDLSLPESSFRHLKKLRGNWRNADHSVSEDEVDVTLRMDDHGLFITGIIHDIVPTAEVHLIRALGGYGVSDSRHIIELLERLPRTLLKDDSQRLIVNMSLGFTIPPGVEILRLWLRETYAAMEAEFGKHEDLDTALRALASDDPEVAATLQRIIDGLQRGLKEMIAFLQTHPKVLVVAAAGNDNGWFSSPGDAVRTRPEPRWPARYDGVLGVAAVGRKDAGTDYSNRGDVTNIGNGVATFGGNAKRGPAYGSALGSINTLLDDESGSGSDAAAADDEVDAVHGIYISDKLTLGEGPNHSAWVYWAGTSFAAPVISGIAAALWSRYLEEGRVRVTPQEIINQIVGSLYSVPRDPNAVATLDCPTIDAWQQWVDGS